MTEQLDRDLLFFLATALKNSSLAIQRLSEDVLTAVDDIKERVAQLERRLEAVEIALAS